MRFPGFSVWRRSLANCAGIASVVTILLTATEGEAQQADYRRYYDEDNLPKVREVFQRGRYELVIQICDYALSRGQPSWEWRTLLFQSLARVGRYEEAVEMASATTELFSGELGALLRAHELFTDLGLREEAGAIHAAINRAAGAVPTRDRTALDLVHLGEAALVLGADPARVIEQYFGLAKTFQPAGRTPPPGLVEAYLAAGRLALAKDDLARAADEFREAFKLETGNVDALFGLAESFLPNDRKTGGDYLEQVLELAPRHEGALLLKAESAINYERYAEAEELLAMVESVNPRHPLAAAYRAALAELAFHDAEAFEHRRKAALSVWNNNPEIDYLIGRVLSRNYRHAEGAESQKRALAMDPDFLPAKLQLALDYLRLGKVDEAWPLAEEVAAADEYNILAYNLAVLRKEIESFASIRSDGFIIRMPPNEAEIYGDRVLEILAEAKGVFEERYGFELEEPTLVEFYPNQQDFAIRSFGSLGGEGLLGVCFGSVVTMNSPGSMAAGKNNWEATLWHEYCHVVTLTATKNKMPRWLSEGISVYEEIQRQPNWGQRMNPRYRRMILEEEALTSIGRMSSAFFNAESPEHLMFAYYQSMLVVEFIVDHYGLGAIRGILGDLADGVLINDAIARHTRPMSELEEAFAASAMELATAYGPEVDWREPDPAEVNPLSPLSVAAFLKRNPTNFSARQMLIEHHVKERNWSAAAQSAEALVELLPDYTGRGNGYSVKALAQREMGDAEGERETLQRLAERSAEALQAYTRLLEMDFEGENWSGVLANAGRTKAINPFHERLHFCRGCAHEARQETDLAVAAFEKTLLLNPVNPSGVRYRLAGLLQFDDEARAKRYLLDALADAPRFLDAYAMLADWNRAGRRAAESEGEEASRFEKRLGEPAQKAPAILPEGEAEAPKSGGGGGGNQ